MKQYNKRTDMTVRHTIEEGNHLVRIYLPGEDKREYLTGRWPVTEENTSVGALWSGYFEAEDLRRSPWIKAENVWLTSTDTEAMEAFIRELYEDEPEAAPVD